MQRIIILMKFEATNIGKKTENKTRQFYLDMALFISCQTVEIEILRDETGMTFRNIKPIPGKADGACDRLLMMFTKEELENLLICTGEQLTILGTKLYEMYPLILRKENRFTLFSVLKGLWKEKKSEVDDSFLHSEIAIQGKIAFLENLNGLILMALKTLALHEEAVQTTN